MRREHFDFYGYNSPWDGVYIVDGNEYFLGEDYRSVKRFKEYKDVGFNIVLLQHRNEYKGEKWQTSSCKKCLDKALGAGLKRVIVSDKRLKDLCIEPLLVGETGKFKTEEELVNYIKECMKPYASHPAFYGVQLFDEPKFQYLKEYAKVHKIIESLGVVPQSNLLNLCAPQLLAERPVDAIEDYRNYLEYFAKESGTNYLMTDEYAFRRGRSVSAYTLPTYTVLADVCKRFNIELRLVMQSFCQEGCIASTTKIGEVEGGIAWRRITENDMYWQMNLAMGFGCKEFSFFTYFTKYVRDFNGPRATSDGIDGAAFINLDGTRTKLYYYTKKIIKEMKDFESVLLKYDFNNAYYFLPKGKTVNDFEVTSRIEQNSGCPITVVTKDNPYVVTELVSENGKTMYMVQNIGNPMDEVIDKKRPKPVDIILGNLAKNAKFYYKGKLVQKSVEKGVLTDKLGIGKALFIEVE